MGDVGELAAFGLAIGFSPLHIGLLLLLNMDKGSSHRTGLDLLAAGALLGLGMKELLDQFCAMPLPLLLAISAALEGARSLLLIEQRPCDGGEFLAGCHPSPT